ncbi:MAG: tryptophan--tRNA ligase [Streptosporangiales bacterium]|nr:tryptophan--tRNA ligase [Streptosporangiales bacterium]MBO0889706.1 tryptophan--tRNA ligase [Acidothermales bacterium]
MSGRLDAGPAKRGETENTLTTRKRRVFSGTAPSGRLTLGNLLGAVGRWTVLQYETDCLFSVVDLHAVTTEHDPRELAARTREFATTLFAAGLNPDVCTVFVQGHVPEHLGLTWLMECTAYDGELRRMIQYREKARQESVRVSLLTYPALMAADILLYGATEVPVGEDQRQHVELARDLALRFNHRYGETFVVPEVTLPRVAARLSDLQEPTRKMSKSDPDDAVGVIRLLDPPEVVRRKVARAVTDSEREVRYDPGARPGVANLLDLLAAFGDDGPEALAERYASYGELKSDVTDAVVDALRPIQERYRDLVADPGYVDTALAVGAHHASDLAAPVLARAQRNFGLLPLPAPAPSPA